MREVITIGVGQCGNQISFAFWEKALKDHMIGDDGKFTGNKRNTEVMERIAKLDVFAQEMANGRYVPRAIFADLEPGVHEKLQAKPVGKLFAKDRWVAGVNGAGNCWASGFFTEGSELMPQIMDELRREMEACDCPQAVQVVHSIGGGTGSGMGSLMLERLASTYLKVLRCDYTVYPSKTVSDTVVEPYNAMCAMPHLIENCDANFVLDNQAIYNISNNVVKAGRSAHELNNIITNAMLGSTAGLRFNGNLNTDLRKLATNLVPFPRLHFFLMTEAPLQAKSEAKYRDDFNIRDIVTSMVDKDHYFAQINTDRGKFLTVATMFRGTVATEELEKATNQLHSEMFENFVNWIPDHFKTSHVRVPSPEHKLSATFLGNTTAMKQLFSRISKQFGKLFKRKAFLAPYKSHGMDEMMFQEAQSNVKDLIQEYSDRNDVEVDPDSVYEDWMQDPDGDEKDGGGDEYDEDALMAMAGMDDDDDDDDGPGGHVRQTSDSEI